MIPESPSLRISEKWTPLLLLGVSAMFLSEALIWNVANFSLVLAKGPVRALLSLLLGTAMYVAMLVVMTDVVHRFKVRDLTGLVLLGSIYGLLLEGIFPGTIFFPAGLGFNFFGIWTTNLLFPALSWHALIDFSFALWIFRVLLKGGLRLSEKGFSLKEAKWLGLFCFYWFIWTCAKWLTARMPGGIPPGLQFFILLYPAAVIGLLAMIVLKMKSASAPEKILTWRSGPLFWGFILFFAVLKFFSLPNNPAFFFLLFLIAAYFLLFLAYAKWGRGSVPENSIYGEAFPVTGDFSAVKYLKIVLFILFAYALFKFLALSPAFFKLSRLAAVLLAASMALFAAVFPFLAVYRTLRGFLSKRQVMDRGLEDRQK
ncbi:MAG: hypothetical protein COT17_02260 [Elusimicrobia bacterium CG08_land_8_20_14_0_20_51_18]|nr:MAG: hypothetical protein COT17_02260 [Elusimicrobia bacterium CG08_land_8_20_14_0_20_51_18]